MTHHYALLHRRLRFLLSFFAGLLLLLSFGAKLGAQLPPNIDFSSGNFTNWKCWVGIATRGTVATGTFFDSAMVCAPIGGAAPGLNSSNKSRHFITSGPDTDYYGGFPIVSPTGGLHSLRIGNDSTNQRADRVQYFIHVPPATTSFNIQCQFAVVLQDPGHNADEQPTFQVVAYDSATGIVVPAANNLYIARYAVPGFLFNRAPISNPLVDSFTFYLPWTMSTINLSGMAGKTVILECTALDCLYGGHFGYGYFDVIGTADSLMASIVRYNSGGDSVVLQGPPGYKNYQWYNQDFSLALNAATDTARTKSLAAPPTPQYYNLIITPYASIGTPDTIHTPRLKEFSLRASSLLLSAAGVYPNPADAMLHITFPSPFEGMVSLLNSSGQSVYFKRLPKSVSHDIPTTSLAAGIYTLVVKNEQGILDVLKIHIKQ